MKHLKGGKTVPNAGKRDERRERRIRNMLRTRGAIMVLGVLVVAALLSAACSRSDDVGVAVESPQDRTIYMAAIEPKGSTTVDKEPFPSEKLPAGKGYGLKPPDEDGKWVVETYRFEPGTIIVNQGDTVTLEIVGINGAEHPISVEGYGVSTVLHRGEVQSLTFVADKPGIFKIVCATHQPTMEADLVVLRRGEL
ncbi:MAG: cupredoxin domain-containing protein [Dehalococcoidia bacterium]